MKLLTTLLLLIVTTTVNPAYRPYEPKMVRQACDQKTYNALCVPKIKTASQKVNWI